MNNIKFKISLFGSLLIMILFLLIKTSVLIGFIPSTPTTRWIEFTCFIIFIPLMYIIVRDYLSKNKEIIELAKYAKKLNKTLISQSHNTLFYDGNVIEGGKILTYEVTNSLDADRCSIWLFNDDKTSIICEQLYVRNDEKWFEGIELFEKDFKPYFKEIKVNPIIIADNVNEHPATKCFKESYSDVLGVKSMLDVPIKYKGEIIGVICIESLTSRKWIKLEVSFAQMLSSLYSFAYSIRENNETQHFLNDFENFVDSSTLVSKADKYGKITYVNKKFTDVSGWSLEEVLGKDHNIVNSGVHSKEFWADMYKTVISDKKIWNSVVTNKTKNGDLYWVDTFIKGNFDSEIGQLEGFTSIRQDVTEIYKTLNEINKKNTYLEHAAKILRHDMHSGINTYIPRGVSSLERRLNDDVVKKLKLEAPLKMLKEGLKHTQKVYKGVYEFTNLVKKDATMTKESLDLKVILETYLKSTVYSSQVIINELPIIPVNESLFCTAIDNLIRNGLKYNDSENRIVKIFIENDDILCVQDNGRGLTQDEFERLSEPYVRKDDQKEQGTGLGLNICIAILNEHGFNISCEKNDIGTKIKIKIK
jgi:PAS domain S-box-containing protein